jgi:hypothetical protein
MVKGLDKFKEYFEKFPDSYIIIGGTACDINMDAVGLSFRRTDDIDIILIVEALNSEFVRHFWTFIKNAEYEKHEMNTEERKYYRFKKPSNQDFPYQLELFSRKPDILDLAGEQHLTPIPVEDNLSSLSAILLNDDYYHFTIDHSIPKDGLHWATSEALICLKAKAFLNLKAQKEGGEHVDDKKIKKHKLDVFRLALLLTPNSVFDLPASIKADMQIFSNTVKDDLPEISIFKEMGAGIIDVKGLFNQIIKNFGLINK